MVRHDPNGGDGREGHAEPLRRAGGRVSGHGGGRHPLPVRSRGTLLWNWNRSAGTAVTCRLTRVIRVWRSRCGCSPTRSGCPSIRADAPVGGRAVTAEHRQPGVSWEVHRILASVPDRFELIGNPPLSERTGRRRWSAEVAKKLVGWKTEEVLVPVTAQEKVEAIREQARGDEAVAAQVATDFLRRPEVAFKAMRNPEARENANEAQFEQAELEDDEFEEDYDNTFGADEDGDRFDDPARIVHSWRKWSSPT
ncbi:DUF6192 family protein [Streptomyces chartreusis]|uniref:DUF6192 family protein n=1 Tax=Streptomyces chartreusis TaxID=1969 RepID=UPI00341C89BB